MSIEAMVYAWSQQVVDHPTDRWILAAHANYASPDGSRIFPGVETIMAMTGYSERTVRASRGRLLKSGVLVEVGRGPHGTAEFDMPGVRGVQLTTEETTRGCSSRQGGVQLTTPGIPSDAPKPLEPSVEPSEGKNRPKGLQESRTEGEQDAVQEIWDHYVTIFDAKKQTLNPTRRRLIQQALKVRDVGEIKRAIEGLRVSPWHNGENPSGETYLDIRYALKGNGQKGESNEERIDEMGDRAPASAPVEGRIPIDTPKVQRWLKEVRYTVSPGGEKARGHEAYLNLIEAGFSVTRIKEAPWVLIA